jgi:hypothetical protein
VEGHVLLSNSEVELRRIADSLAGIEGALANLTALLTSHWGWTEPRLVYDQDEPVKEEHDA